MRSALLSEAKSGRKSCAEELDLFISGLPWSGAVLNHGAMCSRTVLPVQPASHPDIGNRLQGTQTIVPSSSGAVAVGCGRAPVGAALAGPPVSPPSGMAEAGRYACLTDTKNPLYLNLFCLCA